MWRDFASLFGSFGISGQGRPGVPGYLGAVATRTITPSGLDTTNKQMMARRYHRARDAVSSLQIVVPNFGVASLTGSGFATIDGTEQGSGGTATVTASIEYPAGTFTQVKFSGSASGTIADNSFLVSDAVSVAIPRNVMFWTRVYFVGAAGSVFQTTLTLSTVCDSLRGDAFAIGTALSDQTMGGTITTTDATKGYGPVAILAETTRTSFALLGDSRCAGLYDDPLNGVGELAKSLDAGFGYINLGVSSDRAQWFVTSHTNRLALAQYCSAVLCQYGTNDLENGNRTAAQVLTDRATIRGYFANKDFWDCTVVQRASSTDNFATTANQTTNVHNPDLVTINTAIRGLSQHFDTIAAVENAQNTGIWKANGQSFGYTVDGTHESDLGYRLTSETINHWPLGFSDAALALEPSFYTDLAAGNLAQNSGGSGSVIDGSAVGFAKDLSLSTDDFAQATSGSRPTYDLATPALVFGGSNWLSRDTMYCTNLAGDWTAIAAFNPSVVNTTQSILDGDNTSSGNRLAQFLRLVNTTLQCIAFNSTKNGVTLAGGAVAANTWYVATARQRRANAVLRLNAVQLATATTVNGTVTTAPVNVTIGSFNKGQTASFNGKIGRVGIWPYALLDTDVAAMETEFAAAVGLSL